MKTYKNFLNESAFDYTYRNRADNYIANLLCDKIREEFNRLKPEISSDDPYGEEDWDIEEELDFEELPKVIKDVMDEFYYKWKWRDSSIDEVLDNALHFVHYYIMDDGETSFDVEKQKLIRVQQTVKRGFEDTITDTGAALFMLEKLGVVIPCVIILSKKVNEIVVLSKPNSFTEAMKEFDKIRKEMGIEDWWCRVDMCSVTGKLGINILPVVPV